jgi:Fe2+ transport system protein FeoA
MREIKQRSELATMTLADLKPGQSGRILVVGADGPVRSRLLGMGFRRGELVTLIRRAPLNDPLEFRLGTGHISIRRSDAARIEIAPEEKSHE